MTHSNGDQTGRTEDVALDVRTIPHVRRHETIFALIERLSPGQALVITNDHDPAPLGYQLRALYGEAYGWEYVEKGPEVWRVAIRKSA